MLTKIAKNTESQMQQVRLVTRSPLVQWRQGKKKW
jgi:hypothetical protein